MDPFIGMIQAFPYSYAPRGWALCNGAELLINQNSALFSLIGFKFGGDGQQTFKLPNLMGAAPDPGMQYYIAVEGLYPSRW